MDVEIAHYGALGMVEKMSHLKLLKRWFNKLRMDKDWKSTATIIALLQSEVNRANALKEALKLLKLCIERDMMSAGEILSQLHACENAFKASHLLSRIGQSPQTLSKITEKVTQGRLSEALKGMSACITRMDQWIEDRTRYYLIEKILMPNAEDLGIAQQREWKSPSDSPFGEITRGEKIHYLVYRYLRNDPRVRMRQFKQGEHIVRFGEWADSCFIILEGSASVAFGTNTEEIHVVREVSPFTIIGEIALIHQGGTRTASVCASTDLRALEIPHEVFSELMGDSGFRLFIEFLSTDRLREDRARTVAPDRAALKSSP
jgi:hypothetical protein